MAAVLKVAVLVVVVAALTAVGVSAQTHHVVGGDNGWGPDLDVSSWVSGRVFSVGDKIWFKNSGSEDTIMEVGGVEEFVSCNLTNPLRMYTDPINDVVLEKEGIRYFVSGNPEMCKNGLKLPVPVHPSSEFDPDFEPGHGHITPPFDPSYDPTSPPFDPSYDPTSPPFEPHPPICPPPPHKPPPIRPPPPQEPKPVHPPPSAAPATVVSFTLSAGLLLCYYLG
ncbi:hypothetical protein ACS0TY_032082 [Phlomoides rotata]